MQKYPLKTISFADLRKGSAWFFGIVGVVLLILFFKIYMPVNPFSGENVEYVVKSGMSAGEIAEDLHELKIIRDSHFFKVYVALSLKYSGLQAGKYSLSPRMSIHLIASKMANGDVVKNTVTILEGWTIADIDEYLDNKNLCLKGEFTKLASEDWSQTYDFLKDKPKALSLEGYLFPDTYEFADGDSCQDIIKGMLSNFGKKLTAEMRTDAANQKKSIFEVVTMASMLEKEVRSLEDKKLVAGILWKRLSIGMALQIDATVNYITGKNDPGVSLKDTKIDSLYNTYKYRGLPKGPISNPGTASLMAALEPTKSEYWYYLSNGATYFSKTFEEHVQAKATHLN